MKFYGIDRFSLDKKDREKVVRDVRKEKCSFLFAWKTKDRSGFLCVRGIGPIDDFDR